MARFRMWLTSLRSALRNLNLFHSRRLPDNNDEYQLKNELISTRLFLFLLFVSLLILIVYTSQVKVTQTITIDSPTLTHYLSLYERYGEILVCPCTNIAITQEKFISLKPTFHQVCKSDFVSTKWFYLINAVSSLYVSSDFRDTGSLLFQILASFCNLSEKTIESSLPKFYSSHFVTANVMNKYLFNEQCKSLIDLYISTTSTSFAYSFDFTRDAAFVNGFLSGLSTNFNFILSQYISDYSGYRIFNPYKIYNQNNICKCEMTPSCLSPAIIQNKSNNEILLVIPGFYTGCLLVEAMRQSNLQCLYDQICINNIQYYLQFPVSFNTIALNSSKLSRYNTSTNINQILINLMVESWSENISYDLYYYQCQPKQCTYIKIEKNNLLIIFTTLIGLFGGLYKVLFFLVPLFVKIIRHRKNPINLIDNQIQTVLTETHNNHCCCNKMQNMFIKIFKFIKSLNLFSSSPESIDEHNLKSERISTRLYIILLTICFIILLSYKATENITETIIFKEPSFDEYQILYKKYNEKLTCPCSMIAIECKTFLYIKSIFHQLCSSDFVSKKWINAEIWQPTIINTWDFRRQRRSVFSAMSSFCSLANGTIFNAMISFNSTQMISSEVLSENLFHKKTNQFVADFIQSTNNIFSYNLEFIRASTQANQIMSGLNTNSVSYLIGSTPTFDISIFSMVYNGCYCPISNKCTQNAIIFSSDATVIYDVAPGLLTGCYLDEATRRSTLQCFYNRSCVDRLMSYLNFTVPLSINTLDSNISSIYNITSPIDDIVNNLMIEQWIWNDSFKIYYEHCNPSTCFYQLNTKTPFIIILTTLIGLLGGLIKVLRFLVPQFVKFLRRKFQAEAPRLSISTRLINIFRIGINTLHKLNLFRSTTPSHNEEQQRRNEIISTRIFICLLFTSVFILIVYTSQIQVTQTIIIDLPTFEHYSSLYEKHGENVKCHCSNIAIAQQEFISLIPIFHPICESDFIDSRWSTGIINAWSDYVYNRDFRYRGPGMFQALNSICILANNSINNALIDFNRSTLISDNILSEDIFNSQMNVNINLFITSISNSFTRSFRIIRDTTQGNGLVSNILSSLSFRLIVDNSTTNNNGSSGLITLRFKKYNNQICSCHDTPTCKEQCYVYKRNTDDTLIYMIPGFVIGCYVFEGLLQSNLICLFNQSCIDQLRQAIDFNDTFTTSALNLLKLNQHKLNSTVENLMGDMMVEQWIHFISYKNYFNQCKPIYCKYIYTNKYNIIFIITTIIAIIGGLTIILQILIPHFVKLIQMIINKRQQRRIQIHIIY